MKKLAIILALLLASSTMGYSDDLGYDFMVGDLGYSFIGNTNTVEVSSIVPYEVGGGGYKMDSVVIPRTVFYQEKEYTVTRIGHTAFRADFNLKSVTLPSTITSIGIRAFEDCRLLTHFEFPDSLLTIGDEAFNACKGLQELVLPAKLTSIGGSAFSNCTGIKKVFFYPENMTTNFRLPISTEEVIIGDNVKSIPPYFCAYCDKISSVDMPESVTTIGDLAFCGCTGFTSITIPKSVTTIKNNAFYGCTGIKEVTWNAVKVNFEGLDNLPPAANIEKITLGDEVVEIPQALAAGSKITSIVIPNSVKALYQCTFMNCIYLASIHIPSSVTFIDTSDYGALRGCTGLTEITVDPANTKYESPDNCNAIISRSGHGLIVGCKNTVIPKNVRYIGSYAFEGCSGLKHVELPDSLTSIGVNAFYKCTGLTEISFPSTVETIGARAFAFCGGISKITALSNFPPQISGSNNNTYVNNATFYLVSTSIPLYVPKGAKERYKSANGWQSFNNIIELDSTSEPLNQFDVNCDGQVDISDVNAVINYMLGKF